MSNELNKNAQEGEETAVVAEETALPVAKKAKKPVAKKENFFKRFWKKFVKLCKDTVGEMKKVTWTPKNELIKNTKLVLVTVIAIAAVIAVIDTGFAYLINWIAGLL